jgi:hypothetical protein
MMLTGTKNSSSGALHRIWWALALACILGLLGTGGALAGPPQDVPRSDGSQSPEACAKCHPDQVAEWTNSPHALAARTPNFLRTQALSAQPEQCLTCHSTGFNPTTGQFVSEGITCDACHGAPSADHPDAPPMQLPVNSEVCRPCHAETYVQWQASGHGQRGVECFYCHRVHSQALRTDVDEQCQACHQTELTGTEHNDHKGVLCSRCHMPISQEPVDRSACTGLRSHGPTEDAGHCVNCHAARIHDSQSCVECHDSSRNVAGMGQAGMVRTTMATFQQPLAPVLTSEQPADTQLPESTSLPSAVVVALGVGMGIGGFLGLAVALVLTYAVNKR